MSQSSFQKTIAASMTNFLAAGAIVAGGSGSELWKQYLGLTGGEWGLIDALSANCFGAAIGAFFGGFLSDRFGRQTVFSFNMLAYMVGIALSGTATSFGQLLAGFIITGVAVGASVSGTWTYVAEVSEPEKRGRNMAISQAGWGMGPAFIFLLTTLLAPGAVWFDFVKWFAGFWGVPENHTAQLNVFTARIPFLVLYVIALIDWIRLRQLEESKVWKEKVEQHEISKPLKERFSHLFDNIATIFNNKKNASYIIFLSILYLLWNLVNGVMGTFQTNILEEGANLSHAWSQGFIAAQWTLTFIITLIFAPFVDKMSQRTLFSIGIGCAIAAWALLLCTGADMPIWMLIIFTIFWAAQGGISVQLFFGLWTTEAFPVYYRAAALGVAFCIVRTGSVLGSIAFTNLYDGKNPNSFFFCCCIALVTLIATCIIGYKGAHDNRGKALSEVSADRQ